MSCGYIDSYRAITSKRTCGTVGRKYSRVKVLEHMFLVTQALEVKINVNQTSKITIHAPK